MAKDIEKKALKAKKMKRVSSPGQLAARIEELERLDRKMSALLQKMDLDGDLTAADWESTVDAVE